MATWWSVGGGNRVWSAADEGDDAEWRRRPRIELLAGEQLLAGAQIDYPARRQTNLTFRRAGRATVRPESIAMLEPEADR